MVAAPDHAGDEQISYAPDAGGDPGLIGQALGSAEWKALIGRISQIPEPVEPVAPSPGAATAEMLPVIPNRPRSPH